MEFWYLYISLSFRGVFAHLSAFPNSYAASDFLALRLLSPKPCEVFINPKSHPLPSNIRQKYRTWIGRCRKVSTNGCLKVNMLVILQSKGNPVFDGIANCPCWFCPEIAPVTNHGQTVHYLWPLRWLCQGAPTCYTSTHYLASLYSAKGLCRQVMTINKHNKSYDISKHLSTIHCKPFFQICCWKPLEIQKNQGQACLKKPRYK